jgi:hypothetical protein
LQSEAEDKNLNRERKGKALKKIQARQASGKVDPVMDDQFMSGRVLGKMYLDEV